MNTSMINKNDFSSNLPTAQASHSTAVETAKVSREVEAAVMMANKFPRVEQTAFNRIVSACTRPAFAEKAMYSFKRGGSKVEGPSIRLAENAARCWGNLQYGVKEVERKGCVSTVEAYCWDLETNTRIFKEFTVAHIRDTKKGPKHLTSERDIYELIANQGARRVRKCILACIPEDVIESAMEQVNKTLMDAVQGNAVDIQVKIRSMVESYMELGVKREQLEIYLNTKVEAASIKQLIDLGKIHVSIKEGYAEIKDFFKMPDMVPELAKEQAKETADKRLDKLYEMTKQASDLGIPKEAIHNIGFDSEKPSTVETAIDMLETMIADKTLEKK